MGSDLIYASAYSLGLTAQLLLLHQVLPGPTNKTDHIVSSCITQHKEQFINKNAFDHLQPALTVSSFPSFINAYRIEFKSEAVIFTWKRFESL